MKAVIMAAGKSTRTYPLTLTRPKPLLKIANKTILAHQLDALEGLVDTAVLVVGYKQEMIREAYGDRYGNIDLRYVVQTEQLGTGHAILQCAEHVDGPFLAMNGDDLYAASDLRNLAAASQAALVKTVPDPRLYGIYEVTGENRVVRLVEKPKDVFSNLANIGAYKFSPDVFRVLRATKPSERGEIEITSAIQVLAELGDFRVVEVQGYWLPIGYPWHLLDANEFLLNTQFKPEIIGDVSAAAHLSGAVSVGKGSRIRAGSVIDGPVCIGENSDIGPNCWIRPGSTIGNHCRVGQGVEIKNSILFDHAAVPHLSYVGDSVLGEYVNFGCGTITANFRHDGKNHRSQVKDALIDTGRRKLGAIVGDHVHTGTVEIYVAQPATEKPSVIWDEADLLEFAEGSIANVFGEDYAVIDTYARRVRLPMPPYLLVSRVVHLEGALGEYKPSRIITEYDIPHNAWYTVDRQASWAISVESGQCDLLLISYLGIDLENRGESVYRLLDCTMTFLDELPMEGDTLRYDIRIESFARSGANLLFFFNYDCYIGERQVLKMRGGCAGFFSDYDLAQGGGIITTAQELAARQEITKQHFLSPLYSPITSLGHQEMFRLTRGEIAAVFGRHYDQQGRNPSLRLPPETLLMIDEIPHIDPQGGRWGLGLITGEKYLDPTHWYFPCHFKDDEVLAGSLMAEGCGQLLQAYMLYLGLQAHTQDARFQPLFDLPQVVRCRGQVTPQIGKLTYHMEIKEIGLKPHPYVKADVDIILKNKTVVRFEDLGLQLLEKMPAPASNDEIIGRKPALFNEQDIEAFCTGSIARCFGQEYLIYEGRPVSRIPNGDFKLMSRVLDIRGKRHDLSSASLVSEYDVPPDVWYYRENAYATVPYSILMEIALQPCGFLSAYLGTTLTEPDVNFKFRNLDGDGRLLHPIDVRGQTITNQVKLINTSAMQGMIVQTFTFELSCDGSPFFVGNAVFGHFADHVLDRQLGLDAGQETFPAYTVSPDSSGASIALATSPLYDISIDKPHYHLSGDHFKLLDEVLIGDRYIYAEKAVNSEDWFFACHFYQDPVMPGSLGVEAMLQAMQAYALYHHLGHEFRSPHFDQVADHQITWKYRGQVLPTNHRVSLEVFVTDIVRNPDAILIFGEANLWKDNLRIYNVNHLALRIQEDATV